MLRADIGPFGWVINQSLTPLSVTDPVLLARKQHEAGYIAEVVQKLSPRTAIIPWLSQTPVGAERLLAAVHGQTGDTAWQAKASW